MNRKKIMIGAGILSVLVLGIVLFFAFRGQRPQARLASEKNSVIPSPEIKKPIQWTDPAGFSFLYPDIGGIVMNKHDEDQENYAHAEMTEEGRTGNLTVWAKDAPAADLATWIKKEKRFADAPVFDTTLGGEPAKKILINSPSKMIVVGAFYDGMLVTVEAATDTSGEWEKRHDQIVSTLVFSGKKPDTSSPDAASSETEGEYISVDEEEVVE